MTHSHVSIATIYSSAQCVLSVVGSVGVILLFAGIPQLIYSPTVSASNLLTFIMGAVLIITMVAGNSFLNYKYRAMNRDGREGGQGENGDTDSAGSPDDKPPSYESVITLDGLPPEYSSIVAQKPPRYEEIVKETFTACGSPDESGAPNTCETQPQAATPQLRLGDAPSPRQQRIVITLSKVDEDDLENGRSAEGDRADVLETAARIQESEATEQDADQGMNQTSSSDAQSSVASEEGNHLDHHHQHYGESET